MRRVRFREIPDSLKCLNLETAECRVRKHLPATDEFELECRQKSALIFLTVPGILLEQISETPVRRMEKMAREHLDGMSIDWAAAWKNAFVPPTLEPALLQSPRCECGSTIAGSPSHSSWCPKHE